MSKIFTLIIDDDHWEAIEEIIAKSPMKNHCDQAVCRCVETIPHSMRKLSLVTALDLIEQRSEKKLPIDFAFVDMEFTEEFIGDRGAEVAIEHLMSYFPDCRILILSRKASEYASMKEYNGKYYHLLPKSSDTIEYNKIIKSDLEAWTRQFILQRIKAEEKNSILENLFLGDPQMSSIKVGNDIWLLGDIFPSFTAEEFTYSNIQRYISFFPIVAEGAWERGVVNRFVDGIRHYYEEFYFYPPYKDKIEKHVNPKAKSVLDSILNWLIYCDSPCPVRSEEYSANDKKLIANLERQLLPLGITGKVTTGLKTKQQDGHYSESDMRAFMSRLTARLVAICSNTILGLSRELIYRILAHGTVEYRDTSAGIITGVVTTSLYLTGLDDESRLDSFNNVFPNASFDERVFFSTWCDHAISTLRDAKINEDRKIELMNAFVSVKEAINDLNNHKT